MRFVVQRTNDLLVISSSAVVEEVLLFVNDAVCNGCTQFIMWLRMMHSVVFSGKRSSVVRETDRGRLYVYIVIASVNVMRSRAKRSALSHSRFPIEQSTEADVFFGSGRCSIVFW